MKLQARPHRTLIVLVTAVVLLAGCGDDGSGSEAAADTGEVPSSCSTGSLSGRYLYEVHGNREFAEGPVPYLEVGELTFDGEGGGSRIGTDSITLEETTGPITYDVDERCIGTLTIEGALPLRTFVSPAGDEVTFFEAGADTQPGLDGEADRASEDPDATCAADSLTGTYQYRSRGAFDGEVHIEHGFEVYDGDGAVTNSYRVNGTDETEYLAGAYTVEDDCRATVTYEDGPTLTQYLAPDGSAFFWIQTDGFEGEGIFGGHEHLVSTSVDTAITTAA